MTQLLTKKRTTKKVFYRITYQSDSTKPHAIEESKTEFTSGFSTRHLRARG